MERCTSGMTKSIRVPQVERGYLFTVPDRGDRNVAWLGPEGRPVGELGRIRKLVVKQYQISRHNGYSSTQCSLAQPQPVFERLTSITFIMWPKPPSMLASMPSSRRREPGARTRG